MLKVVVSILYSVFFFGRGEQQHHSEDAPATQLVKEARATRNKSHWPTYHLSLMSANEFLIFFLDIYTVSLLI